MKLLENITRTAILAAIYNFIGFWIAKGLITLSLATTVHTNFGVKYVTIYGHAGMAFCATLMAFIHGWEDDR